MNNLELIARLCDVINAQSLIIKEQNQIIQQSDLIDSMADEREKVKHELNELL